MKFRHSGIFISGTGSAIPSKIVSNFELERIAPTNADWVKQNLGIETRRHLSESETLLDLMHEASLRAIQDSNISIQEISAIVVATSTSDFINPSMATLLHGSLNAKTNTIAFDIQAVCSGFLFALGIGSQLMNADNRNVLIVAGDQFSSITDFSRRDSVYFGDGVGAVVLSQSDNPAAFLNIDLYTDNNNWQGFYTPRDSPTFKMVGSQVKSVATLNLPAALKNLLDDSGKKISELHALFPHQPSKLVLDEFERELGLNPEILKRNLINRGNTAGGSIPLLLDESRKINEISKNALIGFAAVGSGWTWGSALTNWIREN